MPLAEILRKLPPWNGRARGGDRRRIRWI